MVCSRSRYLTEKDADQGVTDNNKSKKQISYSYTTNDKKFSTNYHKSSTP